MCTASVQSIREGSTIRWPTRTQLVRELTTEHSGMLVDVELLVLLFDDDTI
jgi:hypothetical protein